jgi:hypothetical protein
MLVHLRMAATLLTAQATSGHAGVQHVANDILIGSRSPCRDGARRNAHIGAVHVQADALGELCDHVLA